MRGRPADFWSKFDEAGPSWHPLEDHCADVGACAAAVLASAVVRCRFARLAGEEEFAPVWADRLAVLAALHDLGKFNQGFQGKVHPGAAVAGHVREAVALLASGGEDLLQVAEALGLAELVGWCASDEHLLRLLVIAVSHHGRPCPLDAPHRRELWRRGNGLDPIAGLAALGRRLRSWVPAAFDASGPVLPSSPAFENAFGGLVTLADWIGSDRSLFHFREDRESADRMAFSRARAPEAIRAIGLDVDAPRSALGGRPPGFEAAFGFPPREVQRRVVDLPVTPGGGLVILEAETGAGKTEAALARFFALFSAGEVDGLYFALPTRTAATQIHRRVTEIVARSFPAAYRPPVVLAVPGYLAVDDREGHRLPGFEVLWNDDEDRRFRHRGWAAERPKRYLAGAIVIGTVDQVLLSGLLVDHAHLRGFSLLRHLLVVDEVHASDAYMNRLLEEVLARHLAAGGHALLMSATLGAAAASRLLRPGARERPPGLEEARAIPYPSIRHLPHGGKRELVRADGAGNARCLVPRLSPVAGDAAAIARRALDAASAGGRVLVLRNTVRDCLAVQEALEAITVGKDAPLFRCAGVPAPHHSRYSKDDRTALDVALEMQFGKRAAEARVAVATQTVQQSLDLDADLLLTDLCPMDVLLQRAGRLHRHGNRVRPTGFETPVVEVLVPDRELGCFLRKDGTAVGPHGIGTVYSDLRILEATLRLLWERDSLRVPEDSRELVERSTHPEALDALVRGAGGAWQDHAERVIGATIARTGLAQLNLLDWQQPFGDRPFPSTASDARIQTRLGEGDRLVRFVAPPPGPFGLPVRELTVPAYLARGVPVDAAPEVLDSEDGEFSFRFGPTTFRYDRLGLRPRHTRSASTEDFADA